MLAKFDLCSNCLQKIDDSMARNLGHQWEVLKFDLPLTEVEFVHAIGWQETRN